MGGGGKRGEGQVNERGGISGVLKYQNQQICVVGRQCQKKKSKGLSYKKEQSGTDLSCVTVGRKERATKIPSQGKQGRKELVDRWP